MMEPVDPFAAVLAHLLENGTIPSSRVRGRNREKLKSLMASGILQRKPCGGGMSIVVSSLSHFREFVRTRYPSGLYFSGEGLPPRASGVAASRNSKRLLLRDSEPVLLRGFDGAAVGCGEDMLPVEELTEKFGMAAFINDGRREFWYEGDVATVENLEVFTHFHETGPERLAVYTGGRCSGLLLGLLASRGMSGCRIIHYGDWDPVGLDEYLRIGSACPGRTELYMPDNLEELFEKYGNRDLLKGSSRLLNRLRKSDDAAVSRVVSLIHRFNCCLEQEVLLTTAVRGD